MNGGDILEENPFEDAQCVQNFVERLITELKRQRDLLWKNVNKLEKENIKLLDIMGKIEYIEPGDDWYDDKNHIADWLFNGFCPWCQYKKGDGHYHDCPIGEILENE